MVLGETNTSAIPVPAVVNPARPTRVDVKAPAPDLPNSSADLPNQVRGSGILVPAFKALRALSALDTQLNTPTPGAP